ncbi:MAG: hypothetical protein CUR32_00015 [Flavobacterium sp.]|nr:MAG: hypothetical protein CUR32_00015 [Flavobacterium sp.] [Flavobacterium sp. FEMGT703F]
MESENRESPQVLKGSVSHLPVIDLTDNVIDSPIIRKQYVNEISDYKITISIEGIIYGFEDGKYIEFYKFIDELSKFNSIYKIVSIEFLVKQTLLWTINVYKNGKSEINLVSHILNLLSTEVKTNKYYYPILNLSIEEPFKIHNAEFTFFTKEYFDEYWEYLNEKGKEDKESFEQIYRKYQGRVFVAIEICAEENKAEELAYDKASLAVDIIKLLSPTVYFPSEKCFIDLEKRAPYRYEHISIEKGKKFDFKMSLSAYQGQFEIKKQMIEGIETNMLISFARIMQLEPKNDFELTIISAVQFFAKSISENDLHLRVSHLIMIIESIFLLEDENFKMENKCKKRMCHFLYSKDKKNRTKLYDDLTELYDVRHKMTHKFLRKYIELEKLRQLQISLIDVILGMAENTIVIKSKTEFINKVDELAKVSA